VHLVRTVTPLRRSEFREFAPLVLRLSPSLFSQVLPLGVGFEKDGVRRGWLETWYSDGWYLAFNGNSDQFSEGVAMFVRPESRPDGSTGLTRFRYGFFPGEALPGVGLVQADDELQIRLRGTGNPRGKGDTVRIAIDVYVLSAASYRSVKALALRNSTPASLLENCRLLPGALGACAGTQTIVPRPPLYMFRVREPLPSTGFFGDQP